MSVVSVGIKLFEDANGDEIRQLLPIANRGEIMRWIGRGDRWDAEYLAQLTAWSHADRASSQRKYWHWLVLVSTGTITYVVGYVGLRPLDHDKIQIRYFVDTLWQGKGVATRAIREVLAFVCSRNYSRIYARVEDDNAASLRVISKLGFRASDIAGTYYRKLKEKRDI